jgi:hypothetical protein
VIRHVQLACPAGSEAALREFYGGVLELDEVAKPPVLAARGGCWFRGHGIELHLGVFAGMRRFYSQDPHGNRLEFLEPIDPPVAGAVGTDFLS